MNNLKLIIFILVLFLSSICFAETHVFWYKALQNNYALNDSPGPNIPENAVIHEGMIASGSIVQSGGADIPIVTLGNGSEGLEGRCAYLWSEDLNNSIGDVDSAFIVGEFLDGWNNGAFCIEGIIKLRIGCVEFTSNQLLPFENKIPEDHHWVDSSNPLSYSMSCNIINPEICEEDTIDYFVPSGRQGQTSSSKLDKQFLYINITNQINFILSDSIRSYAIVFLVIPNDSSFGKLALYSSEDNIIPIFGSDNPWTKDGNTAFLALYGYITDLGDKLENRYVKSKTNIYLSNNFPNPFSTKTNFEYNICNFKGYFNVYNLLGSLVFSKKVMGQNKIEIDANNMPEGVYICKLSYDNKSLYKRFFVIK